MKLYCLRNIVQKSLLWFLLPLCLCILHPSHSLHAQIDTGVVITRSTEKPRLALILLNNIELLEKIKASIPSEIFNAIFSGQHTAFLERLFTSLQHINWRAITQETPQYVALYKEYQAKLDELKQSHTQKVQAILNENEDALLVSKLIAPEELSKMLKDDDEELEIEPESIEEFFQAQQKESLDYQQKQADIKSTYYKKLIKMLPEYSKLDAIKKNIISYLITRTDNSSIKDSLQKFNDSFLIDQRVWRSLANALIQIIFDAWTEDKKITAEHMEKQL